MENNDTTANECLNSVPPQPAFEALEKKDNIQNTKTSFTMETEDNHNSSLEEGENDGLFGIEKELESYSKLPSTSSSSQNPCTNPQNILNNDMNEEDDDDDEEYAEDFENQISEQYIHDDSQSYVEHVIPDKHDPIIVIKKLKNCNNKDIQQSEMGQQTKHETTSSIKSKKLQNRSPTEMNKSVQPQQLQLRSSTPKSREYLALQRSVNESKILTEFVTETFGEKPRKSRIKDSANTSTSIIDHSYSSIRKNNSNTQLSPEKPGYPTDDTNISNISPSSQGKRQNNKRYAPLKDDNSDMIVSSTLRSRSRSKSMHNSEFTLSGDPHKKLKKWPSEERLHKRKNMRSENSEFVQKQMQFLQRVMHSSEPRSRSRSRSVGRKSPHSLIWPGEEVDEGNVTGGNQQKSHKITATVNKERSSKRIPHEAVIENDDQQMFQLSQVSLLEPIEHPDDVSVNESNTSMQGASGIVDSTETDAQLKFVWQPPPKPGYDSFCWKCHEANVKLCCSKCVRSFHAACAKMYKSDNTWVCPECATVDNMLNNPKRSRRNEISPDLLSQLLTFAFKRMRYAKGHTNFEMPYENSTINNKYIINAVTLNKLKSKIDMKEYRCAEELVNETKWMLHNAYVLSNGSNTKTAISAKAIFKICRQEVNEIETCAECYLNANTRTDWFVDVCSHPHLLLWAKLKGFPYWPAKAMGVSQNSLVNVRFFGEHDRACVPMKDCFLYSEQDPNTATGKRAAKELADCIKEVQEHIEKIKSKVGAFKYAEFKTPYEPADEMYQLEEMMPGVQEFIKKQQVLNVKPSLQFKIYKTADNHLSIVQKASTTPELPSTISHDSEDNKKKSSLSEEDKCEKLQELNNSPPNYEVISKQTSDDTNTSKLSTVILKRKSVNGDPKRSAEEDTAELPLPKMTKIEDFEAKKVNAKRKSETQSIEKPKTKYSKAEPKVPVLTIKTSVAKEQTGNKINEANTSSVDATAPQHPENKECNELLVKQKVVENVVAKNKQGVTIKKHFNKDVAVSPEHAKISLSVKEFLKSNEVPLQSVKLPVVVKDKQKAEEEKARENQKVNNLLKGLVPFIEVKQEKLSDNELETEKPQQQQEKVPATDTTKPLNNPTQVTPNENVPKTTAATSNTTPTVVVNTSDKEGAAPPLIAQVKEEIVSDDDEANTIVNSNDKPTTITLNAAVESPNVSQNITEIRVVGDTTIQKINPKNLQNQYITPGTSSANNNNNSKRSSLKGIPYGPLPASAFPTSISSKLFHQNGVATVQARAKKTFPQQSPPMEKLRSANVQQNTCAQIISNSTSTTNSHLDPKKSMAKTTMVAIPVDVAVNRISTTSAGTFIGSIPVPPLTAVSKTIPHPPHPSPSTSFNSMTRNSPPQKTYVMAQTKTTTSNTATSTTTSNTVTSTTTTTISSPITVPPSLSAPSSAAQHTSQVIPLTMSAPPPLAGLSGSTLSATPKNGLNDSNAPITTPPLIASSASSPSPSLGATQSSSTDTHLLGGLVTPTLASAITDVICRGPPKLAIRPSGPLQSEGHPMFPSQAGPVCKRLMENVHKLTDFFISVVEDTMGEMAQGDDGSLQAKVTLLSMELERSKQAHEQEIAELKRTSDLMLCEMRKSMENEKTRLAIEIRKQCEAERIRLVEETKRKQWCANCFREANFYCCWNTSYCDYPCQQLHWSRHAQSCAQSRSGVNDIPSATAASTGSANNSNQQQERHHATKSNSTTSLNTTGNFNKTTSTTIAHRKEKPGVTKTTSTYMMPSSSSMSTAATTSSLRPNTEVLKLPTNTYLRPVTSTAVNNNQTLRGNTAYSLPVQRFNVPEKKFITKIVMRRQFSHQFNIFSLPNHKFISYFRLNKDAFKYVLHKIAPKLAEPSRSTRVPNIIKLVATMRILAEGSYQKGAGSDGNVPLSQSAVSIALKECINVMYAELCPKWISYEMDKKEELENKLYFYKKSDFPGIIGCITSIQVKIISPGIEERAQYMNSQGNCSLNAMLVCDHKQRIRYISPHNPGSAEDHAIWNASDLKQSLKDKYGNGKQNTWLLGDANYPLEHYLMTPYQTPGINEIRYNAAHAKATYSVVPPTLSALRNRFRCLLSTKPLHYSPEMAGKITAVCAALHNICIHYNIENPEFKLENDRLESVCPQTLNDKKAFKMRNDIMQSVMK